MPLTISLRPQERIIIGSAVLRNHGAACRLTVENHVPILREKNILSPALATTPARQIYLAIQLLYVDEENAESHYRDYWPLTAQLASRLQGTHALLKEINSLLFQRRYYQALRLASRLISIEDRSKDGNPTDQGGSQTIPGPDQGCRISRAASSVPAAADP